MEAETVIPPEYIEKLERFRMGFGMVLKNYAQIRGELFHHHGIKEPSTLLYVLSDIETNLNRLVYFTNPALFHAEDNSGREDTKSATVEANTENGRTEA
jgi:hypothetical protein